MRRPPIKSALAIIWVMITTATALADVRWDIVNRLTLDAVPRDVAVTVDGRTFYILTEKGDILIYGSDGVFRDKIPIGPHADSLKIGQDGGRLYVISRQKKTIEALQLDFIRHINTAGAPFKGPKEAPVVMAVFSDFQ